MRMLVCKGGLLLRQKCMKKEEPGSATARALLANCCAPACYQCLRSVRRRSDTRLPRMHRHWCSRGQRRKRGVVSNSLRQLCDHEGL